MPGRTCLASIESKGGKSKSFRSGLLSISSLADILEGDPETVDALENDLTAVTGSGSGFLGLVFDLRRQKENEEDQRGQDWDFRRKCFA